MLIDHEAVVADLEAYFLSRNSHGQRSLLQKLAELRKEHRIKESRAEQMLRTLRDLDTQSANGHSERASAIG